MSVDRPLAGVTILDLLDDPIDGATRLYVQLGADVRRREPHGRYGGVAPGSREGLRWIAANLGKTLIGAEGLADEIRRADLIVASRGEDLASIERHLPHGRTTTAVMAISPFGRGTPQRDWQATDAVLHALSGELSRSGIEGRAPLLPPGELALQCALAQTAYAGMAALLAARRTGVGDRIDIALLDAAVQALDPGFGISGSATLGRPARDLPPARPPRGLLYPILPCADGAVRLCVLAPRQWQAMFRWMGEPAAFAGPEFNNTRARQESAALLAAMAGFVAGRTREELEREGGARGVPISGVLTTAECLAGPHVAARGAIATVVADGLSLRLPDGVIELDGERMGIVLPPPSAPAAIAPPALRGVDPARPLAGLKVLDLGVIVVGGEQGRLLADLGADVVKVESAAFPDGTRHSYLPTGLSVSFAAGHRNKRSLGLHLRSAAGKALFRRLAGEADVLLSNFKPGTMAALGFGPDDLAAINPRLVSVESSAFGASGPWAGRMGYGPLVRAAAGLTARWRYPDDPSGFSDSITIYPDHVGARLGAAAALALLFRGMRTGRGGHAALSQMEVMLDQMAGDIAADSIGAAPTSDPPDAPWGVFRAAGEDEWCVVTVRDDRDWTALCGIVPSLDAGRHPDRPARLAARDEIDGVLAAWMAGQDADAAMRRLQAAGVPAARMLRVADLPDFDYYRARDFFRVDAHPHMDEAIVAERRHMGARLLADPPARPAPLMGEHSAEVVRDWLGLDEAEIAALIADDVLQPVPADVARLVAAGQGRRAT